MRRFRLFLVVLINGFVGPQALPEERSLLGYSAEAARTQRDWEAKFHAPIRRKTPSEYF